MKNEQYKRIAVMLLGPLGDIINSSCVFSQLKKAYPDAKISAIAVPAGIPSLKGIPEVDDIYKYEPVDNNILQRAAGIFKFGLSLRNKFDLMVVLDNTLHAGLISFLSRTPKRVGREGDLKKILLTDTVKYTEEEKQAHIPVKEHYLRCLKPLGLYEKDLEPYFVYSDEDKRNAEKILKENNLSDKKILGFCPVTYDEEKSINIDDAVSLINFLNQKTDYQILILGGKDTESYVKKLEEKTDKGFVNLVGKTSFCESACIIDKCSKFISIDTSQMHLAFAMKTPCVCLFFSDIYEKWGPRNFDINRLIVNQKSQNISEEEILKNLCEIPEKTNI